LASAAKAAFRSGLYGTAEAVPLSKAFAPFGAKWLRYAQQKDGAKHDPPCICRAKRDFVLKGTASAVP
jgi:hypothetical protein